MQHLHTLYADHHGWIYNWLRRRIGHDGDAADLAQDTFLRLMLSRKSSEQTGTEPRALLTHIAKGLVVDRWRRREIEQAYLAALALQETPLAPSPETQLLVLDALYRIDRMLDTLPPRTREVFLLSQLEKLKLQDIATRMGMPVITVRRHVQRALVACAAVA